MIQICSSSIRLPEYKLVVGQVTFKGGSEPYGAHNSSSVFYTTNVIFLWDLFWKSMIPCTLQKVCIFLTDGEHN